MEPHDNDTRPSDEGQGSTLNEGSGVLSWKQIEELTAALATAFRQPDFEDIVLSLNKDPDDVVPRGMLFKQGLRRFVTEASKGGWVRRLVSVARDANANFAAPAFLLLADAPERGHFPPGDDEETRGGIPGLSFDRLGAVHMHVDSPQAQEVLEKLRDRHLEENYPSEVSHVVRHRSGPQREVSLWSQTYQAHTPGATQGTERFDTFLTTRFTEGPGAPTRKQCFGFRSTIREVLTDLQHHKLAGCVVELERVVGTVDETGRTTMADTANWRLGDSCPDFDDDALLFRPEPIREQLYELHFSLNIARSSAETPGVVEEKLPLELDALLKLCQEANISVGGWFLFFDSQRWAYRSNVFTSVVLESDLKRRWTEMRTQLERLLGPGKNWSLRLLAEKCLALWRTPLTRLDDSTYTVHDLAAWENKVTGGHFWVVAPNFLGDQEASVRRAMLANIRKGVRYTYFLRTSADAMRWLKFKNDLMDRDLAVKSHLRAFVVTFAKWYELRDRFGFIANPGTDQEQAMHLKVDERTQKIYGGSPMGKEDARQVVKVLQPLLDVEPVGEWREVVERSNVESMAVLHLKYTPRRGPSFESTFDKDLAIAISRSQGEVFSSDASSLVVGFSGRTEAVCRAVRFTKELRTILQKFGESPVLDDESPTIGIDCGTVERAIRSYGMQWGGAAVRGAREILGLVERPGVFLSKGAAAQFQGEEAIAALKAINDELYEIPDL